MELQLLFLLLPIAALSGWWIGQKQENRRKALHHSLYSGEYFRGLNYLINEQPDKAIDVFLRMVEVDSETVDTHFALASLFRRRGEVDRAIRIHQNLIARPTLTTLQRKHALFELAKDYQSAGLLDRAEGLYQELSDDEDLGAMASRQLLDVYQQEREWSKAIEIAQRLSHLRDVAVEELLCHYYCELAESALAQGELHEALTMVRHAPPQGDGAVRASLLEGKIALALGNGEQAINAFKKVEQQAPEFLPEALESVNKAYKIVGKEAEWVSYLEALASRHPSTSIVLARCTAIEHREGGEAAARVLEEFLRFHPSVAGMERYIRLQNVAGPIEGTSVLAEIAQRLTEAKPRYRCGYCGFSSRTLYWQCPGCKQWGTTKPIYGIEGE